jgi:hypothetical protein
MSDRIFKYCAIIFIILLVLGAVFVKFDLTLGLGRVLISIAFIAYVIFIILLIIEI